MFTAAPRIEGALSILQNPKLTSLPGLAGITGLAALTIRDNPMLSECAARDLEAALLASNPAAAVDLGNNLACAAP